MLNKYFLPFLIVIIVLVLITLVIILVNRSRKKVVVVKKKPVVNKEVVEKEQKIYKIKDMIEIAANRDSKASELKEAIDIVARRLPFPKKKGGRFPNNIRLYLHFVLLIASHRHANAKLIAYMDRKLKRTNPQYSKEIDIYENEGFNQRSKRL